MINLLRSRRSIRKFESSPVPPDKIVLLQEALLRSPSSRGKNPWEFIFVQDPAMLKQLAHAKEHGGEFLDGTPLGVVILGDETITDVWIEDCSIAAIILQLTAHDLGLGSCWVQIRNRNNVSGESAELVIQKLLSIPPPKKVLAIVGIGTPSEIKHGIAAASLKKNVIHREYYGNF
ncbi:MAG TPA: nitroreductase family protein [Chitinispirillaceae bacterium]|nr:nitroreductase family protein [Chitinispirillaceae bacterium]